MPAVDFSPKVDIGHILRLQSPVKGRDDAYTAGWPQGGDSQITSDWTMCICVRTAAVHIKCHQPPGRSGAYETQGILHTRLPQAPFMTTPTILKKNQAAAWKPEDSADASPSQDGSCICDCSIMLQTPILYSQW